MSDIEVSVVIPMYNEQANVDALFDRLLPALDQLGRRFEVVCVDDGSKDATVEKVQARRAKRPEIVLVRFARNFGQHAAVTAGFANARGRWIVTIDADLQNPPEEIPKIVAEFARGHDLVNTHRMDRQDTFFRRWASKQTNRLVRRISGIKLDDFGCMLRGYSREVAQAVVRCREYRTFIPALASLFARDPVEIEVAHAARSAGESKYPLRKLLSLQLDLITNFSVQPLRALFLMGSALAIVSLLIGAALIAGRLYFGPAWANSGTLTVLGVLTMFCGLQFFAFGLVGEYIGRIFQQVRLREPFIVRSIERAGEATTAPGGDGGAIAAAERATVSA